jgi:hypothetical protein
MEWSKGVIFLMATFCPDGLWTAELLATVRLLLPQLAMGREWTYQTTP